jgi:hypothetical protein
MKVIVYTLNSDGTIPDYVTNGGYLYWENGGSWPQNFDLVGAAIDTAPQTGFADEAALLSYMQDKDFTFIDPETKEETSAGEVASALWAKFGA